MITDTNICDYCLKEILENSEFNDNIHQSCESEIRSLLGNENIIIKAIEDYFQNSMQFFFSDRQRDFFMTVFFVVIDRSSFTIQEIHINEEIVFSDLEGIPPPQPILTQITQFKNLHKIYLHRFQDLGLLPLELCQLPLTSLEIIDSPFSIPNGFFLSHLENLLLIDLPDYSLINYVNKDLISLNITNFSVFEEILHFNKLQELVLRQCNLHGLPDNFSDIFKDLAYLDLSYNRGIDLSNLSDLPNLKTLKLASNHFEYLPFSLSTLSLLEYFDLHENYLLDVPNFSFFPNLKTLLIDFSDQCLIHKFFNLNKLERLLILVPRVNFIPDYFKDMIYLKNLSINIDRQNLPEFIFQLPNIQKINLLTQIHFDNDNGSTIFEETIYDSQQNLIFPTHPLDYEEWMLE